MLAKQPLGNCVILGAGGGGRTVVSIIEARCKEQDEGSFPLVFLDDAGKHEFVNSYPVLGPISLAFKKEKWSSDDTFIVAFGSLHMLARERIYRELMAMGRSMFNAIHPRAIIDRTSIIGNGNIVCANCIINPNSIIGGNCYFCVAVTIDHDCKIGNNVYLSPGVNLSGGVSIDDNVFIGTNATIIPQVHIGKGAVVGAGAVVLKNIEEGLVVAGVPAKPISRKKGCHK